VRRETFVAAGPLTADEVIARLGPDPRLQHTILFRRAGWPTFAPGRGRAVDAGDEVVFYEYDKASDDDMTALNALFSPEFYPGEPNPPWADEVRVIEAHVPERGARVLEICCGAGRLAATLARAGNHVVGLDTSRGCVVHAAGRDRSGSAWIVGDALALPFADRAFDVACVFENSLGVLFAGKSRAVAELIRVARARVIIGLREDGPDAASVHTYWTDNGYLEAAQTFTAASAGRMIDAAAGRERVLSRSRMEGDSRPWGGREFFEVLTLG
jgi:SAM-dependent methyltransferase